MHSTFQQPTDGLYHIASIGDHPHKAAGLVQVIDKASLKAIVDSFRTSQQDARFPGVLVDYDHASLDADKPSEAAGWICDLQIKEDGLYAAIRWTDKGSEAIDGGRYRYISPVFRQNDCEVLENNRVRPKRLLNCALTNDPNLPGLSPLTNRAMGDDERKAMFARMAQEGGGGGGGGRGGRAAAQPANQPAPGPDAPPAQDAPAAQAPADQAAGPGDPPPPGDTPQMQPQSYTLSSPKLTELQGQREALATMKPEPPPPPIDPRKKINPDKVFKDTLRATNNINAAREAEKTATAAAARSRLALAEIRGSLRKQGLRGKDLDEAIDKRVERDLKAHEKEVKQFDRQLSSHERAMNRLDLQVATEEMRLAVADDKKTETEWKAVQKEMAAQVKADMDRIRNQAKADAAKAKQAAADAKANETATKAAAKLAAADAKKNDPFALDRAHLTKVRQYAAAVERGDLQIAERMFPGRKHDAFKESLDSAGSKNRSRLIAEAAAKLRV